MIGLKSDWLMEEKPRHFVAEDYQAAIPRWCPGCGDHAILTSIQKLCKEEQLKPEETVFVSGIGCSSRFPHYMNTYGFHGLHGRALPLACGIRSRRPDLNIFVSTGDGDCTSIGAGHWLHAIRYNMKMVVMLFDNQIYGLTKMQTSPTTPVGAYSNTHPMGAWIEPLNPISVVLGITNASFVATTIDWNPPHLYATLKKAYHHNGTAFIRIVQRCPHFTPNYFTSYMDDPSNILLMDHEDGIPASASMKRYFKNNTVHDPSDLHKALELASRTDVMPIGMFYRNDQVQRYHEFSAVGLNTPNENKLAALEKELNRFSV
ncbi:MAG: 2-oxoglutarate oxidoreductase [Acidobacteria bacterium]|nr:MAG: 2-oxoglutarate oxidoreductase [Acidobacteriota bacterium]